MQEDWVNDSKKFISDILEKLGHRPSDKHSLDRINNDGDYEIKETNNLRWANSKTQANNTRRNHLITIHLMRNKKISKPNTRTLAQWEEFSGINRKIIIRREKANWDNDKLLNLVIKRISKNPTDFIHNLWCNIKNRCYNKNSNDYKNWGAKDVIMYEPWKNDFNKFKEDLLKEIGERPSSKHQLDRFPKNDGNYEPGNVRWATSKENNNNKINNVNITINGETNTATEWDKISGIDYRTIVWRFKNNWNENKLLSPILKPKNDIKSKK